MDDDDRLCECICNHSGACTGCGICWLKAFYEQQDQAVRALFRLPGGLDVNTGFCENRPTEG